MLDKARDFGHLKGVDPHLIPGGVSHQQYTNDNVLLFQPDIHNIATVKTLLVYFEAMSGMKINFAKSEAFIIGLPESESSRVADLLNCKKVAFPITHLGLPCAEKSLTESDWDPTIEEVIRRSEPWQRKLMSSTARLTFTNACLSGVPTFAMGLFILEAGFFREVDAKNCKYHMVRGDDLYRPKKQGCLGISNSRKMNLALVTN